MSAKTVRIGSASGFWGDTASAAPALLAGESWPVHLQPAGLDDKIEQLRELRRQCKRADPKFDSRENALVQFGDTMVAIAD